MYLGDRKIAGATKNIISRISCELEFEKQSGRTFLHMSNVSGVSAASIERIHKNPTGNESLDTWARLAALCGKELALVPKRRRQRRGQ